MISRLYLQIDERAERAAWYCPDAAPGAESGSGSLADAVLHAAGRQVTVFVPAASVTLFQTKMPEGSRRQQLQALPFLIEEQFAADVETLHFAFGEVQQGMINVAVVAREQIEFWLGQLSAVGIEPQALVPESLALPLEDGAWSLARLGSSLIVRQGLQSGIVLDWDNAQQLLPLALNEAGESRPARLCFYGQVQAAFKLPDIGLAIESKTWNCEMQELLARSYVAGQAINLLQGVYSRKERWQQLWRPWRVALILLTAYLLSVGVTQTVDAVRLSSERDRLQAEIESIYRQAFPGEKNVPSPRLQMERHLKELHGDGKTGSGDFLGMLATTGRELKDISSVQIQRINYKDGALEVAFLIADLQMLDQVKQKLMAQGRLNVEIQGAAAHDNHVEARLRITERVS
ncbi:MAG: type II secretion system protein GspL [Gammaproteobacteria bacterium]|nr:type II secretion system protein GspL [Gammaproteobacteria bacterium]